MTRRVYLSVVAVAACAAAVAAPVSAAERPRCEGERATVKGDMFNEFVGTPSHDVIVGTTGDDVILAGPGDDLVCGRGGRDVIYGDGGADEMLGGRSADIFVTVTSNDRVVNGGPGSDVIKITVEGVGVRVNLRRQAAFAYGRRIDLSGIEGAWGSNKGDVLIGNSDDNLLVAASHRDVLRGLAGDDVIAPGSWSDEASGGSGDDILSYFDVPEMVNPVTGEGHDDVSGHEALQGVAGVRGTPRDDVLLGVPGDSTGFYPGMGDDTIWADRSEDTDTLWFNPQGPGVDLDLRDFVRHSATGQGSDTFTGIDFIVTTGQADVVRGGVVDVYTKGGDDSASLARGTFETGGGNDVVVSRKVDFTHVVAGRGNDRTENVGFANGGPGDDTLIDSSVARPGPGDDYVDGVGRVTYTTAAAGIVMDLPAGTVTGQGSDTLLDVKWEIEATDFDDTIVSTDVGHTIRALYGDDTIEGRGGDDTIYPDGGSDTTYAGSGDDFVWDTAGGPDHDVIDGGDGEDTCWNGDITTECEHSDPDDEPAPPPTGTASERRETPEGDPVSGSLRGSIRMLLRLPDVGEIRG